MNKPSRKQYYSKFRIVLLGSGKYEIQKFNSNLPLVPYFIEQYFDTNWEEWDAYTTLSEAKHRLAIVIVRNYKNYSKALENYNEEIEGNNKAKNDNKIMKRVL